MDTENMREQNPRLEVDFMHLGADEQGKVKNGKAAKLEVIQEERNDIIFIPAFDLDEKAMNPALLQALETRGKARKTEYSVERNKTNETNKNKTEDGHSTR